MIITKFLGTIIANLPGAPWLYAAGLGLLLTFGGIALHTYDNGLIAKGKSICEAAHSEAEFQAVKAAAEQAAWALAQREQAITEQTGELERMAADNERLRNQTSDPDFIVLPADDSWLRSHSRTASADKHP